MNYASIPLILVLALSTFQAHAASQRELAVEAEDSIYEFFNSSGRKVQKVDIENYSHLNSGALDYLVEAEVKAQSAVNQGIVPYHCGVFIKKNRNRWESQQTVCEPLPAIYFGH